MRKIIFTLGLVAAATAASAQVRLGLYGLADFPQADFHKMGYYNGGGFGMSVMSGSLTQTTATPNPFVNVHVGGNMDFNSFGSKNYNVMLDGADNRKGQAVVSDNSFGLNVAARFIFTNNPVRPYLEAFAGLRAYGTDETVSPLVKSNDYEDQTSNSILSSGTFAYGLSGGLLWKLNSWLDLETGVTYSQGSYAKYQLMDKVQQIGNEIHYSYDGSKTNLLQVKLGVVFRLEKCECNHEKHTETYQETHSYYTPTPSTGGQHNTVRPNAKPGF